MTGVAARFRLCISDLTAADSGEQLLAGVQIVVSRTTGTARTDRTLLG
ncbi:hypothetical protein ABID70_002638 [Clavibacter michiganensis]|nr:hypothetical protein [Clavibacter michiganensis]MBP2457112.1 hypothetical protein [Clavibacter michiganensis]MDQ0409682.1 hypothetical protein [Clavibacter michiganensis]